ncbi:hypothetical protein TNCV_3726671 [Trichonephila clavipes]|nr:hypothetical protein TNCV_3726671 [Trichonephila clavipes]
MYPKSKLSGEFLKFFAASRHHRSPHRKGEQYFALNPAINRPQKIVIKGLPINTDIDDIGRDLTSRGFKVLKVAQFTKSKSKMKLPIFMVEIEKSPDSPDIFKLETCCYLTIKIDTYNRRPGSVQCYRNNIQNHDGEAFGFMDAILELKKFFTDYPPLLELGRQLKNAKGTERVDVFYRHLIGLKNLGAIKEETSVSLCFFPTQFKIIRLKRGRKSKTSSSISPLQRVALPSPACEGN